MSKCDGISKTKAYSLSSVTYSEKEGAYIVNLIDPPVTCKDGVFTTHKGTIVVNAKSAPTLTYTNGPVITVPSKDFIRHIDETTSVFTYLLFALLFAGVAYAIYRLFQRYQAETEPAFAGSNGGGYTPSDTTTRKRGRPSTRGGTTTTQAAAPAQGGNTTIVQNGGNDGFVTGMLVGNMLSGGGGRRDRVDVYEHSDKSSSKSKDNDDDNSSSYSSDSDDSSSSYSSDSDSGSSYGSDGGGSDFGGSDSGGSFGSD